MLVLLVVVGAAASGVFLFTHAPAGQQPSAPLERQQAAAQPTTPAPMPAPTVVTRTETIPAVAPPPKPATETPAHTPVATQPRAAASNHAPQAPIAAPNGGAINRSERRGMPEGMRAKFELMRLFRRVTRLAEDDNTPLSASQARAILAIMTPLRTQKTLTSDQAASVSKQLEAQLTPEQRAGMEQMSNRRGGGGPGGSGGTGAPNGAQAQGGRNDRQNGTPAQGDRPGGQNGTQAQGDRGAWGGGPGGGAPGGTSGGDSQNGGRPRITPEEMAKMNPFNPSGDNPMASRMAERTNAAFDTLEAKAKGK